MTFPDIRLRRLRTTAAVRDLVRETQLNAADFIYPLFIVHGRGIRNEIRSMPGVFHLSVDQIAAEAKELIGLGVRSVVLFGLPEVKDAVGSENFAADGIVQARPVREQVRLISNACPLFLREDTLCARPIRQWGDALTG